VAKIQVQGIGMFTDDTLKKKIIQLANDLQKNAKKGNWNKASENGIRALGRMWGAYQEWSRNNESVNEAGMELNKIKDAILMFQKKIKKQGSVTNARDEDHLKNLIKVYKQMGGKGIKEGKLNERMKTPFIVHPTDPDQTERHFVKLFKQLAKGHPSPIDYGPRESDMYDWNDRRNYYKAIEEYNKYMNKIADGLNKSLDEMNNIWKTWTKIRDKHRKKDKS